VQINTAPVEQTSADDICEITGESLEELRAFIRTRGLAARSPKTVTVTVPEGTRRFYERAAQRRAGYFGDDRQKPADLEGFLSKLLLGVQRFGNIDKLVNFNHTSKWSGTKRKTAIGGINH
jgi:hypothetical protein